MWDAWAVYDATARPVFAGERIPDGDAASARREGISHAAYRVLMHRYRDSPGAMQSLSSFDRLLAELGYDAANDGLDGTSPAAVGNRAALRVIEHGLIDGADELGEYAFETAYRPANEPLAVAQPGGGPLADPNRWQPLSLLEYVDQAGQPQPGNVQRFIGSHWGWVTPFALPRNEMTLPGVYYDPGAPPGLGRERSREYQDVFTEVLRFSATLTPDDGVLMDIGPHARGGNSLGANDGPGYAPNPLVPGLVEVITPESATFRRRACNCGPSGPHMHLADHVGEIAVYAWRGRAIERTFDGLLMVPRTKRPNPSEVTGKEYWGVGWIRGTEWLPYQRETFVTPPFAGYVSGHSTFSRAAAEVLARFSGSEYFPGGMGEFIAPAHDFLVFESGPSETIRLQWATYYDAADEAAISRLYGGIHPSVDDLPGRVLGSRIGIAAFDEALTYFAPTVGGNQPPGDPAVAGEVEVHLLELQIGCQRAVRESVLEDRPAGPLAPFQCLRRARLDRPASPSGGYR